MKEFNAQTGGRYTYVDDIVNLQELALAFASIFDDCDNFIINGCEISETSISSGYVYINGKIRHFSGASGITAWPQYLYEINKTETVAYASGDDKVGRNVYGCAIASIVPTALDALTGEVPAFIKLTEEGGMRMNDAFFGKYALLLQSAAGTQTVSDVVNFSKNINVSGVLTAKNSILLVKDNVQGKMFYSDTKLVVQSQVAEKTMKIVVDDSAGFRFSVNDNVICTIGADGIVCNNPVSATIITAGNICVTGNDIFNTGPANNDACVNINMTGYNNGTSYYRNTIIGDGKGNSIMTITGSTKTVQITGEVFINSTAIASLSLKKNKLIQWLDGANQQIAYAGYNNANTFEIKNTDAPIVISATSFVNICPAIMENGVLLVDKYATRTLLTSELSKKANTFEVYTKQESNSKYALLKQGLTQLKGSFTFDELCGQIGAATKTYVGETFLKTSNLLNEFSGSQNKKAICSNIGAAYADEYQLKIYDSGWKITTTSDGNANSNNKLYARQIGDIVCIQGKLKINKDSDWYIAIPPTIDPPKHDVSVTYRKNSTSYWSGWIEAGSWHIKTANQNGMDGDEIPITITYMV